MTRSIRIEYQNAYYHVMNHSQGRKRLFHDESYYNDFFDTLLEADERFDLQIHAYCLMNNHTPVFLDHYWMEGEPTPLAANIACLDYSVAKPGGKLVAYRWDGKVTLNKDKFISVARVE